MSDLSRRSMWALIGAISSLMMHSYMVARVRAFAQGSPVLRLLAERDHAHSEAVLLERELIDQAIDEHRRPKFVITDRGGQFQQRFRALLQKRGIDHARGRARTWQFNAKVERLFWSLKRWWGGGLVVPTLDSIQRRLDGYRTWHDFFRPHAALDTLTPDEAERRASNNRTLRFTEGGDVEPDIKVERRNVGGDAKLLYPVIRVRPKPHLAA